MLTQAATIIHPARQCISIWRRDSNSGVAITRRLGLNACALEEPSRLQCLVHGWLFIGNQTHPSHVQVGQGPGSLNAAACPPARHADHPAGAHRWLGRPDRATGPGSGPAAAPFCPRHAPHSPSNPAQRRNRASQPVQSKPHRPKKSTCDTLSRKVSANGLATTHLHDGNNPILAKTVPPTLAQPPCPRASQPAPQHPTTPYTKNGHPILLKNRDKGHKYEL